MSSESLPETLQPLPALATLRELLRKRLERDPSATIWLTTEARENLNGLSPRVVAYQRGDFARPLASVPPVRETPPSSPSVSPEEAPTPASLSPAENIVPTEDKWMRLAAIRVRAERCPRCHGLGTLRDKLVFASGSPKARIMFVGEAPGAEEERRGEPFVGPAGVLLDKIINAMGLQRSDVYISNIVKYRPMIDDGTRQGEANRKPTPEEMAASVQYVLEEIEVIDPEVVVALGGTAMEGLLGIQGSVSAQRGRLQEFRGRMAMVTYHPSYLLRNPDPKERRKVWDDMKTVLGHLGMPVPGK